jgi:hypothetical protein
MFSLVALSKESDFNSTFSVPLFQQVRRFVGRSIVDNQPFKILERLLAQAFVGTRQQRAPIVGRSEYRK